MLITHPLTYKTYSIFSYEGKSLLKNYVKLVQQGGADAAGGGGGGGGGGGVGGGGGGG